MSEVSFLFLRNPGYDAEINFLQFPLFDHTEMTHQTPMDYLNRQRIERACYEISTTDDSITDIAYRNGFNDLSYFIRTFKKYKGTTPGKYKKS